MVSSRQGERLPEDHLVDQAGHQQPALHEHKVRGGVEEGEAEEGKVVVEAVEGGGHEVEQEDLLVPGVDTVRRVKDIWPPHLTTTSSREAGLLSFRYTPELSSSLRSSVMKTTVTVL